mmetsp:Transcript_83445/g.269942  ORF Transcript_83445/g.269942 Transcript_83445/m.269942 type:complete len:242 (-) Transcript_83445:187-912(-)
MCRPGPARQCRRLWRRQQQRRPRPRLPATALRARQLPELAVAPAPGRRSGPAHAGVGLPRGAAPEAHGRGLPAACRQRDGRRERAAGRDGAHAPDLPGADRARGAGPQRPLGADGQGRDRDDDALLLGEPREPGLRWPRLRRGQALDAGRQSRGRAAWRPPRPAVEALALGLAAAARGRRLRPAAQGGGAPAEAHGGQLRAAGGARGPRPRLAARGRWGVPGGRQQRLRLRGHDGARAGRG